jgi:hypothetical protein
MAYTMEELLERQHQHHEALRRSMKGIRVPQGSGGSPIPLQNASPSPPPMLGPGSGPHAGSLSPKSGKNYNYSIRYYSFHGISLTFNLTPRLKFDENAFIFN